MSSRLLDLFRFDDFIFTFPCESSISSSSFCFASDETGYPN